MNLRHLSAALIISLFLCTGHAQSWQQSVHYTMDIKLDPATHSYIGAQSVVYINNSPDTLRQVYYHLYYNAFKPGSMMDTRDRQMGGNLRIANLPPEFQGDVTVQAMEQDGARVEWTTDETILVVKLARPLPPNDSTTLTMQWVTRIPRLIRRGGWMSAQGVEYSMSQWYPKICQYDRNGWHAHEYVAREFYGIFGTYDVAITLPALYVLGATGVVQNPQEVGCGYELKTDKDTVVWHPAEGATGYKTWRFHAENVHDFAWVADRGYAHGIARWQDVQLHFLFKPNSGDNWLLESLWTKKSIAYYSRRFGRYAWPQFTVAVAGDGGMEYPMLIMITGYRPGVTAHEIGHQWYYGMIGNNETQEAWLDEGFTQFLTNEAERDTLYARRAGNPYTGLENIVYPWSNSPWRDTYSYYQLAVSGYEEPLTTFHDWFRDGTNAGSVYFKGETMLRMVRYMFGDSLFDYAMTHYYNKWKFHHPSGRDFEKAMEDASGMRLDWFFSQWVGTVKTCDYAINAVECNPDPGGGYRTTLRLSNRSEAVMPLDITLRYEDGSTALANVPQEDWQKPGVDFHLPRWRWVQPDYSITFRTPKRVTGAVIDTSMLLADIDRTNNAATTGILPNVLSNIDVAVYKRWDISRPLDNYTVRVRPVLWYSQFDGTQVGLSADGGYAFNRYNTRFGLGWNLRSRRLDYDAMLALPAIDLMGRLSDVTLAATRSGGVEQWSVVLHKDIRPFYFGASPTQNFSIGVVRQALVSGGGDYPNAMAGWDTGAVNTVELAYSISGSGLGSVLKSGSVSTQFDAGVANTTQFAQWRVALRSAWNLLGLDLTGDLFAGTSFGVPPVQRMYNAAGSTSRDMHANTIHRLAMNAQPDFMARNHLVLPGQGYLLSLADAPDSLRYGRHLLNMHIATGNINPFADLLRVPLLDQIGLQAYAAAGWVFPDVVQFGSFNRFNAEAGATASIDLMKLLSSWHTGDVIADALNPPWPVVLRFTVPFWARSDLTGVRGLAYRWAIGVSL